MTTFQMILCVACFAVFMLGVCYVGNKIVDKISDSARNRSIRKQNSEKPQEAERLAERFERGGKL